MARIPTPLSKKLIEKCAENSGKKIHLFDGLRKGLFLLVKPSGVRLWRLIYQLPGGRRRTMSLGNYAAISIEGARILAQAANDKLAESIDPQEARPTPAAARDTTFATLAAAMVAAHKNIWTPLTHEQTQKLLTNHVFPLIGSLPIDKIGRPAVKAVLDRFFN